MSQLFVVACAVDETDHVLVAVNLLHRDEFFERTAQVESLQVLIHILLVNRMLHAREQLEDREKMSKVELHKRSSCSRAFLGIGVAFNENMRHHMTKTVPQRLFRNCH